MIRTVTITSLGERGDGLVLGAGTMEVIPFSLPGEEVKVMGEGKEIELIEVVKPSDQRREPFCLSFGTCGGCRMQHVGAALYGDWKKTLVERALAKANVEAQVADLIPAHGAGRRRVTLHVRFQKGGAAAGFMSAGSHDLVVIETCPVLVKELAQAPLLAETLCRPLGASNKPLDVQITATLNGLDVDIRGAGKIASPQRLALSEIATTLDLARVTLHGEIIVERRPPLLKIGALSVSPPPGGFLQATAKGEEILWLLVKQGLGDVKKAADLFCGVGPFALRMAQTMHVQAFDSERPAIDALDRAVRMSTGLKPLRAEARDLFRRPLMPQELKGLDAVVLDPPRAGALEQMHQLARAKTVAKIVSVSCDAMTFARDASILTQAGYTLQTVTPVDQFTYSPHVEIVGVFSL